MSSEPQAVLKLVGAARAGELELRLERFYLRALRAAGERAGRTDGDDAGARLRLVEEQLASLRRAGGGGGRGDRLARVLDLTDDEADFLWAGVAMAIDPRVAPHTQLLWGAEARQGISPALFTFVAGLDGPRSRRLALALEQASHPLLRYRLLERAESPALPACRVFNVPPRLVRHLAGDDELDEALARAGGLVAAPAEAHLDETQRAAVRRMALALTADEPALLVEGGAGSGRRTAVALAAAAAGRGPVVALDLARLPADQHPAAVAALLRECFLRDALPLFANADSAPAALAAEADVDGPIAVTAASAIDLGTRRPIVRVRLPVPGSATRRALWEGALDGEATPQLDDLAHRYRIGAGAIARAVAAARIHALGGDGELGRGDLIEGVRSGIAERLGGLAERVDTRQSWDDLVLPEDTLEQVRALVARARHGHEVYERWGFGRVTPRGTGIAALFSGPPGTGKTMLAGIIARELELDLYQVDLSQVVSKWVGETEKQLARIFDAADAGHALLLFDEADALFARRTEVKSSMDRHGNLEVNYLLQRIESFGGFTILTTNLETGIDPAVRRRLAAHIPFWPPDVDERAALWRRMLGRGAPVAGELDFARLARLYPDMAGAHIRNAVVAAAFFAASEGGAIDQARLERAGTLEYRSMGRVLQSKGQKR